jgi:RNA polymerase sigma-70 factor (ECF subfamily)
VERSAPADLQDLLAQSGWLRKLALHLVETPDQADDLVQDTLHKALQRPPRLADRESGPRAWLARVMRNLASNRRRDEGARAWHERAASRPEEWTPGEIEERVRLQRTLADAVLGLEEPYRSAITLHYFEGIAPREIAERQGITYDAARQRIARGVAMLRARLDREHGGDRSAWCAILAGAIRKGAPVPHPWGPALLEGLLMSTGAKVLVGAVVVASLTSFLLWGPIRSEPRAPTPAPLAGTPAPTLSPPPPQEESPSNLPDARSPLASSKPEVSGAAPIDRDRDLHGEVVDPNGRPVAGASIDVFRNESSEYTFLDVERTFDRRKVAEMATDAGGLFAVPLDIGRPYLMEVSARGYSRELVGNRYAGEHVLVRLHLGASIEGRVKRAEDGAAMAGALLRAWPTSREEPAARFRLETETDEEGRFHFDGLPPAEFYLEVTPPTGAPPMWRRIDLVEGERHEVEIAVEKGPVLRGRVVDAATTLPIENAEVGASWVFRRPVRTDKNGEYVYPGFPLEGIYDIHARAKGYGQMGRLVRDSSRSEFPERIDFELLPARRARGRVLDHEGRPLPGAYIAAVSYQSSTNPSMSKSDWRAVVSAADGRFALEDLRSDMLHTLLVRKEGFGTVVYDFPASEGTESSIEVPDVTLQPMSVVRGSVVDESGVGVPDQLVTLRGWNSDRTSRRGRLEIGPEGPVGFLTPEDMYVGQREARTDDLGRFSFADLAAGTYRVGTQRRGANQEVAQGVEVPRASRVDGIRLVVAGGGTIEGRVVDFEGRPVPKAYVRASAQAPSNANGRSTETKRDGRFVLRDLVPGTYQVRAEASYWSFEPGADVQLAPTEIPGVQPGQRDLEIVLRRGAVLHGVVLFEDGRPVERIAVVGTIVGSETRIYAGTQSSGRFQMTVAEDDLVDLEIQPTWTDAPPVRISRVAPGAEDVVLRLPNRP